MHRRLCKQAMLHLWWRNLTGSDSPCLWPCAVVAIVSIIAVTTCAVVCRLVSAGEEWLPQVSLY